MAAHTVRRFPKHIALPQDHGSWFLFLSPLLIGLVLGGRWNTNTALFVLAALGAFLARQPASILVKALSGRRPRRDARPALRYLLAYTSLTALGLGGLLARGQWYILHLAVPGLLVFAWHLWLLARRRERRQLGVELIGVGVLALSAPAAIWVAQGRYRPHDWWLWFLLWFEAATAIVYTYLRLEQRGWPAVPRLTVRLRAGARALAYATFNLLAVYALGRAGVIPTALTLAFALQWAEVVWGTWHPAVKRRPAYIGLRQGLVTTLFTLLFIWGWAAG